MSEAEHFTITIDGSDVESQLHVPGRGKPPWPTVLICGTLPVETETVAVDDLHEQIGLALQDSGIASATFRPRLTALNGNGVPGRPQQSVDDASAVFRELLRRDDVDRERVGVLGYSSGAVIASCLAGRTPRFLAALCLLAPADVDTILQLAGGDEGVEALPVPFVAALRELDPMADAAAHERPTLIVHGAADRTCPSAVAETYLRRMQNAGRTARLVLIPRGDHAMSEVETRVACLEQLRDFFGTMQAKTAGAADP